MQSHRKRPLRGLSGRRLALWAGLAVGGLLPTVGCQVEYAGMTLPSSKYMYDDVQYFQPGPDFPWANTQAATQRARMQAAGLDLPGASGTLPAQAAETPPPPAPGITPPPPPVAAPGMDLPPLGAGGVRQGGVNPGVAPGMDPQGGQPVPPPPPPGGGFAPVTPPGGFGPN
jgi:hypothetical protein